MRRLCRRDGGRVVHAVLLLRRHLAEPMGAGAHQLAGLWEPRTHATLHEKSLTKNLYIYKNSGKTYKQSGKLHKIPSGDRCKNNNITLKISEKRAFDFLDNSIRFHIYFSEKIQMFLGDV